MTLPKDLHSMTAADWVSYGAARRRSMPAPRVHAQSASTNKPHPSFLTPGRPLTDEEWRAKAEGVRAREQAQKDWQATIDSDPEFWNSPWDE